MPIPAKEVIVIPAQEEKTLSERWCGRWVIDVPTPSSAGYVRIEWKHYNSQTGDIEDRSSGAVETPNLMLAVQEVPEVAAAYAALLAAVEPLETWVASQPVP